MKILTLLIALAMPVVASAGPINLIINGGFEAGNTGFTSDYEFIAAPDPPFLGASSSPGATPSPIAQMLTTRGGWTSPVTTR